MINIYFFIADVYYVNGVAKTIYENCRKSYRLFSLSCGVYKEDSDYLSNISQASTIALYYLLRDTELIDKKYDITQDIENIDNFLFLGAVLSRIWHTSVKNAYAVL